MIEEDGFVCERRNDCKWKCFALDKNGFTFGKIEDTLSAWKEWHQKQCGGKLIPVKIIEKPLLEG